MNTLQFPSHWSRIRKLLWLKLLSGASAVWETITGNPVSFTAKAAPLKQLSVAFSPVQEGSGDPSPDNVRPILGWDSLTVEQAGINLWSPDDSADGFYGTNGTFNQPSANAEVTSDYICLPSGVEKLTVGYNNLEAGETGWVGIASFDENKQWISRWGSTAAQGIVTIGIPVAEAKYIRVMARTYGHGRAGLMLAFGQSVPYAPYNPSSRSISITIGQTVYSGWVDVVTGVGEITGGFEDMGSLEYAKSTSGGDYDSWRITNITVVPTLSTKAAVNAISSAFKPAAWDDNWGTWMIAPNSNSGTTANRIRITTPRNEYADSTALKTALSGYKLYYLLETPIPIQLTPQEVESLAGDNTLWSDANQPLTVTYRSN